MNHDSQMYPSTAAKTFPIGVIIPTYNRCEALLICLKHLEDQNWRDFEVIVVDDGSTDSTPAELERYIQKSKLDLRYFRQANSGPARARNLAISHLRSPICLMIGDDIFASPTLVSAHLELHTRQAETEVAGLGLTRWCESGQKVTEFMRWLDEGGLQFAYKDLLAGVRPDWKHFYTSNLSLKTDLLRRFPFDESFSRAAVEDLELGYRIEVQHGLQLTFLPEAAAEHLHPTTFRQACRRMVGVGSSMRAFHTMWPDLRPAPSTSFRGAMREAIVRRTWLLPAVTALADAATRVWCPNPLMRFVLDFHAAAGYQSAQAVRSSPKAGMKASPSI